MAEVPKITDLQYRPGLAGWLSRCIFRCRCRLFAKVCRGELTTWGWIFGWVVYRLDLRSSVSVWINGCAYTHPCSCHRGKTCGSDVRLDARSCRLVSGGDWWQWQWQWYAVLVLGVSVLDCKSLWSLTSMYGASDVIWFGLPDSAFYKVMKLSLLETGRWNVRSEGGFSCLILTGYPMQAAGSESVYMCVYSGGCMYVCQMEGQAGRNATHPRWGCEGEDAMQGSEFRCEIVVYLHWDEWGVSDGWPLGVSLKVVPASKRGSEGERECMNTYVDDARGIEVEAVGHTMLGDLRLMSGYAMPCAAMLCRCPWVCDWFWDYLMVITDWYEELACAGKG